MIKEFLPYDKVRNNALKLAHRIYTKDNFVPDVMYCSLRGGAYMANVISEYFKIVRKGSHPVLYAALVARSYSGVKSHSKLMIDGWTYPPERLRPGDKVMLVDDIFDFSFNPIYPLNQMQVDNVFLLISLYFVISILPIFVYYCCSRYLIKNKLEI